MKCPGPTRSVKNTVSSRFNRIAVTTRKKLISLSVKIFTYIHAKLHCIVASLVGIFRNNDFTQISKYKKMSKNSQTYTVFTTNSDLIDFTLSNARQFYSSRGDPLGVKGLKSNLPEPFHFQE